MNKPSDAAWSPYVAGALAGLVSVASVAIAGKYFGTSTTFVNGIGLLYEAVWPARLSQLPYFAKHAPSFDWQLLFVVGIMIGAFIAAKTSGSFKWQAVPEMWRERFGASVAKRALAAFAGGFIAVLGARLAGGCPSGHGLSGVQQLSLSGLAALVCFFAGGLLAARALYPRK